MKKSLYQIKVWRSLDDYDHNINASLFSALLFFSIFWIVRKMPNNDHCQAIALDFFQPKIGDELCAY